MDDRKNNTTTITIIGTIILALILIAGTFWIGSEARKDNEEAVRTVSLLYLDELAGRREQVVENNLENKIRDLRVAVELMEENDLSDMEHLQAYQARMKRLYTLDKFAFVDTDGLIYTSLGTQDNISEYHFDHTTLSEPEISIFNLNSKDKKVVIAVPVDLDFNDKKLKVCFMEIDMDEMLSGLSMGSNEDDTTFCNIYTRDGVALTDTVLGGLAAEDNLLEAMRNAQIEEGYSYERFQEEFQNGMNNEVSFTYNDIRETLSYVGVGNTDWMLTYLIRESVISDRISSISEGMITRSIIQSLVTVGAMLVMFGFIFAQARKSAKLQLENETAQAELRGKQEELNERLALQKQLLKQSLILSNALKTAEEANKAKTAFLSNMSHEIRTPMNAIIGLDNIALNDPETPEKTKEYLEKIGGSADHLLNLINDILDMSRIESGRMVIKHEEFSFSKLLETINTMISGQCLDKGLHYECHINSDIDEYYIGDDTKLRQVLINILGNSVKFTPEGGKVDLTVERKAQFDGKSTLEFTISDNGIGISKEFLPHIYDPFAQENTSNTTVYGSSGLGLAISKNIIELLNGDIVVESEKDKGTTFTITVTLDDSKRSEHETDIVEVAPEQMSVLIIDDDPIACKHAELVLKKAGISCEYCDSGKAALEKVKLNHARREDYNLILIDWKMPGMDGIETARQIRKAVGNESAIIILTAYRWDDALEEALEAGVDSFIPKPLFASAVIEEFRSALQRRNAILERNKADLTGRHILLAEDVEINAQIMVMVLDRYQMKVDVAENGRIAVDMFEQHEEGYYDAILMDVRMPEIDGLEATRIIRSSQKKYAKDVPIIAMTANAFDEDVQRSLQAGMNAHLSKPVQPEALFETLESLIRD